MDNLSTLDEIAKAQNEALEKASKIQETKFTKSTRGTSGIFAYMKAKGMYFPNYKYFPGYHFVIRNPHFKYEYDRMNALTGKDGWYNRYLNLVLMYVDAEAFNIESIDDSICPGFCEDIDEWMEVLNRAVLSHFNEDNTTEYETFTKLFCNPLKLKMKRMGLDCPRYPNFDDIIFYDRDPEVMEEIKQDLVSKWRQTYYNNAVWLREIYRHDYELADFTKSDSISKPGGLIEAAQNWKNPYFEPENKPIDNGVTRGDSDGFHNIRTPATKDAEVRPIKMDYLKGANDELVDNTLKAFGVSKRMRVYYRNRLDKKPVKPRGRPSKYAGMTEEQIIELMKAEGKSAHDIAQQLRRNKKVQQPGKIQ